MARTFRSDSVEDDPFDMIDERMRRIISGDVDVSITEIEGIHLHEFPYFEFRIAD